MNPESHHATADNMLESLLEDMSTLEEWEWQRKLDIIKIHALLANCYTELEPVAGMHLTMLPGISEDAVILPFPTHPTT